jgi:hypothetical protein
VQIVHTNNHDSTVTFRRFGSGGAFASGADFVFFFTMTPLRDAFVGFLAGTDAVFGADAEVDSTAGAGGGVLTITFAATALYYRGHAHGKRMCNRARCICFARLTYSRKDLSSSPSRSLRSRSSCSRRSLMESRNMISSSSRARNWFANLVFSSHSSCLAA